MHQSEKNKFSTEAVEVLDRESIVFKSESLKGVKYLTRDKLFRSHLSLPIGISNLQLYQYLYQQIINDAFFGINCASFFVGTKGSGKTYTFLGTQTDPGIIMHFARELYMTKEKEHPTAKIYVSFFRYSSDFKDLLACSNSFLQFR
jgi:hypothetical protein